MFKFSKHIYMKNKTSKGFTLIELLIVITIIGILAVAFLPSVLGAPAKGRDLARKGHLGQIAGAIESAVLAKSLAYPSGKNCINASWDLDSGSGTVNLTTYVSSGKIPTDPSSLDADGTGTCAAGEYIYYKLASPQNYAIVSSVEDGANGNSATLPTAGSTFSGVVTPSTTTTLFVSIH